MHTQQVSTMKSFFLRTLAPSVVVLGLVVTCADASTIPLDCTFEESTCQWRTDPPEGQPGWERRHAGHATPRLTGPSVDHTLGTRRGHFVSFSTPGHERQRDILLAASLKSPPVQSAFLKRGACLQFWYFMYGSFVGELNVLASSHTTNGSNSDREIIWKREGSRGPEWKFAQVQLPVSLEDIVIVFEATTATADGAAVHAAIDDVMLAQEACRPSASCDFENGFCGYQQPRNSGLRWTWRSPKKMGGTEMGVLKDHTLGSKDGYFLYLHLSSTQGRTRHSSLTSPIIPPTSGSCFYFWYNLLSEASEVSLKVSFEQFESSGGNRGSTISLSVSTLTGHRGEGWQLAYFNVSSSHEFQTSLLVRSLSGREALLLIDDLDIVPGQCPSMDICDFEHSVCSWQNVKKEGNPLNWMRARGGNLYTVSSARVDHTLKTIYGKYLLLDSNARRPDASSAKLRSKRLKEETEYCLSFWYLMEGSRASRINIYRTSSGDTAKVIHTLQNQKNALTRSHLWRQAWYNISSSSAPFHLEIEGVVGKPGKSDIALDDLSLQEGRCSLTPVSIPKYVFQCKRAQKVLTNAEVCDFSNECPKGEEEIQCGYECDFEDSRCQWKDDSAGNALWSLTRGHTYSRKGKSYIRELSRDHTKSSSQGHFMIVLNDGTGNSGVSEASLVSPVLQRSSYTCKMTFYYVITEPGAWSLSVDKGSRGHAMTHFHLGNTTARYWRRVIVSLGYSGEPFQVSIRVRNPRPSSKGTIAVDDIKFRDCNFPLPSSSCNYWNRFRCKNGACVNSNVMCNFEDNCGDNTDEEDGVCGVYTRCDFERETDAMCRWTQEETSDDFDWVLASGKSFPKPMPDHTTGFSSGHLIKITGHSRFDGDRARLLSPVFESTRNCKMSFYVIVNGTELDMVNVYTRTGLNKALDTKLTVNDDKGVYWAFKTVSIASEDPFQIVLEGVLGRGEHRYVAIDDISLSPECVASTLSFGREVPRTTDLIPSPCSLANQWQCKDESECIFMYQRCDFEINCADESDETNCGACDFDTSSCSWQDISRGKYVWDRTNHTGAETKHGLNKNRPDITTDKAMTLKDGGSMFVRVSLLKSPEYGFTEPTCHIFFNFFLSGNGQLSLYVYPSNTSNFESTEFGNRLWHYKNGAHWRRAAVDIGSLAAGFVLVFRYDQKKGSGVFASAIDDVSFSPSCSRDSPPCEFQCQSTDRCVPLSMVCDMAFDCRHGDDEMHCGEYQRFDFETDVGEGFAHDADGDFYWTRTSWSGEGGSSGVPVRDHTLGTSLGHFLSIPATDEEIYRVQKARMESHVFYPNSGHECSMRFFYHNGDSPKGVIRVFTQTHENGELSKVWEMTQPSKSQWSLASVSLDSRRTFRVIIEGTRSPGYRGGAAIDDVSFTPGCIQTDSISLDRISPTVDSGHCLEGKEFSCDFRCVSVDLLCDFTTQCRDGTDEAYCPSHCNFEDGMCSWISEEAATPWEIGWAKLYGFYDHTINNEDSGHFALIKSGVGSSEAKLSSPLFSKSGPDCSFSFWYKTARMVVHGDIKFRLSLRRNGYDEMLWMQEINHDSANSDEWQHISIALPPCMSRFQISFIAVFGVPASDDIVIIDDVNFEHCDDRPEPEVEPPCQEETHFLCGDGRCVSRERTCDGKQDCCDGSDEDNGLCFRFFKSTFESGLQGWTNRPGYPSQWVARNALTDGVNDAEFPLNDHTETSPLGKYLTTSRAKQITASSSTVTAVLVKEMPAPGSVCSVTFWYQINGQCLGACSLSVRINLKRSKETVTRDIMKNDLVNVWLRGSITINVTEPYEILFEGDVTAGSRGHVNLDDIVFSPGCSDLPPLSSSTFLPPILTTTDIPEEEVCQSTEFQCVADGQCVSGNFKCNFRSDCSDSSDEATCGTLRECEFDGDKCFWSSSVAARSGWRTTSDLSQLPSDCPAVDANGKHGNYVFIHESETGKSQTETAFFMSPVYAHSSANCILKFHYFSRFLQNSTLSLEITNGDLSSSTTLWKTSKSTDIWTAAQVGLGRQDSAFRLSFRVSSPESFFQGFAALDKVNFERCNFPVDSGFCVNNLHTCNDGGCVEKHSVCDNQPDCFDQSDEENVLCEDFQVIDFEDSNTNPISDFQHHRDIEQLSWEVWNNSLPLASGALGIDHSTGSADGHFLYVTRSGSAGEEGDEEAWIFSPELRASKDSKDGCEVTFYALIPGADQRLKVGYCLPGEDLPRASLDVYGITGAYGSFWQKVSFRIFEERPFVLIFMASPRSAEGFIGIDDIIYGRHCLSELSKKKEGNDFESGPGDGKQSRLEPVYLAKTGASQADTGSDRGQILYIFGGIAGVLGLIVIITGVVVYLHTMKIIGKPSKWAHQDAKGQPTSGYFSMDDNGSVQGEMFERSSISI